MKYGLKLGSFEQKKCAELNAGKQWVMKGSK